MRKRAVRSNHTWAECGEARPLGGRDDPHQRHLVGVLFAVVALFLIAGCGGRAVGDESVEQAVLPGPPDPPPGMTCFTKGDEPKLYERRFSYKATQIEVSELQRNGVGVRFYLAAKRGASVSFTQIDILGPPGSKKTPDLWIDLWDPPKGWQIDTRRTYSYACGVGEVSCEWSSIGISSMNAWFKLTGGIQGPWRATLCVQTDHNASKYREYKLYISQRLE
jgi:hypothetical protein